MQTSGPSLTGPLAIDSAWEGPYLNPPKPKKNGLEKQQEKHQEDYIPVLHLPSFMFLNT